MTDIVKSPPAVPALAGPSPQLDLDSSDIALPRVKVANSSHRQVQQRLVDIGQVFATSGDGDADVLYDGKGDGLLFHVVGLKKGKSVTVDGELMTFAFNDPSAPVDAWTTYDYAICLPEVDPELPFKFLLTRSGKSTAQAINTVLKKNEARGPSYACAFRLTTSERSNAKGTWYVATVKPVEATPEGIAASANLAAQIASSSPSPVDESAPSPANEPAI